jgi:predicted amidohydrolase
VHRIAEPFDGAIGRRLCLLAKEFALVVCCGTIERDQGRFYNTHLVAFPDGRLERQRKGELNQLEQTVFSAEARRCAFEWNGLRFGILVCADLALRNCAEEFRALGVRLVLNPSAGRLDETSGDADHMLPVKHGQELARKLNIAYAVANPVGFSGEDFYPGNSWIMNNKGEPLVHLPAITNPKQMKDSVGVATAEVER